MHNEKKVEDYETRRKAAGEWIKVALSNATAAKILSKRKGLANQSLYLTGQSMEAAIKGIARGTGFSHAAVYEWRHNYIEGFLILQDSRYTNIEGVQEAIGRIWEQFEAYNMQVAGIEKLRTLLDRTAAPNGKKWRGMGKEKKKNAENFFNSMLVMSPEEVRLLVESLTLLQQMGKSIRGQLNTLLKKVFRKQIQLYDPPLGENVSDSITKQLIARFEERLGKAEVSETVVTQIKLVARQLVGDDEEGFRAELKEMDWKIRTRYVLSESYDMPLANVGLYMIGAVVWPHATRVRYPAQPGAPTEFRKAAIERKLGASHYDESIGVIKYIEKLASHAEIIAKEVSNAWRAGDLVPLIPHA